MGLWKTAAIDKKCRTSSPQEQERFDDCFQAASSVGDKLLNRSQNQEFYVCRDKSSTIQAVLCFTEKQRSIYIDWLVTNPVNIRSEINRFETGKVRGAGSCLLKAAERISLEKGKEYVHLHTLHNSIGFYEAHGYEPYEISWCHVMKSAEQIAIDPTILRTA
jgi:hypothetical protein